MVTLQAVASQWHLHMRRDGMSLPMRRVHTGCDMECLVMASEHEFLFRHFLEPSSHNSSNLFYLSADLCIISLLVSPRQSKITVIPTCYLLTPICCISEDMITLAISGDVSHSEPMLNSSYSLVLSIYLQKLSAYFINKVNTIFPIFQVKNLKHRAGEVVSLRLTDG